MNNLRKLARIIEDAMAADGLTEAQKNEKTSALVDFVERKKKGKQ
jgi:hypothetical protein